MHEYRFSQINRLLEAKQYKRVFAEPVRQTNRFFTILARRNLIALPRLGLAISKKNIRLAKDRNRIKRIIRESFRHEKSGFANLDLVVMAKQDALKADNTELFNSLSALWLNLSHIFSIENKSE